MGYIIERAGNGVTTIEPYFKEYALPPVKAFVRPPYNGSCIVTISEDGLTVCAAEIKRGKAFAIRVAKFMLKGCLSRMGKHRRAAKNRAAKRAKEEEAI